MSKDIWMPFYIGDYLADTQLLTTEQHGAYLLLIMAYWKNKGPIKFDENKIKMIIKLSGKPYRDFVDEVLPFFEIKDGLLIHPRIEKELKRATKVKASASQKAKDAANARWGKPRESMLEASENECLEHCLEVCKSQSPIIAPNQGGEFIRFDQDSGEILQ